MPRHTPRWPHQSGIGRLFGIIVLFVLDLPVCGIHQIAGLADFGCRILVSSDAQCPVNGNARIVISRIGTGSLQEKKNAAAKRRYAVSFLFIFCPGT
jgi:hypothetical protein